MKQPLTVLVGSKDELLCADRFAPLINRARPDVPVILIPDIDHMGIVNVRCPAIETPGSPNPAKRFNIL